MPLRKLLEVVDLGSRIVGRAAARRQNGVRVMVALPASRSVNRKPLLPQGRFKCGGRVFLGHHLRDLMIGGVGAYGEA